MQVFVPESRPAEIVIEVGRMEERQAETMEDRSLRGDPGQAEPKCGEALQGTSSEPAHARTAGKPPDVGENRASGNLKEHRVNPSQPASATKTVNDEGVSEMDASAPEVADKKGVERLSLASSGDEQRQPLTASQEQEDILEAWRKRRRQEMAALEGAPAGGSFHKRVSEPETNFNKGLQATLGVLKGGLHGADQKQAAESSNKSGQSSEAEDEELLERLRTRLGIEPAAPGSALSPTALETPTIMVTPLAKETPRPAPNLPPSEPDRAPASSPQLQSPESFSHDVHPSRHSFPQSPRGAHSHPVRFSSNTPPVSPRRSLSPAASGGKRSVSEPATSRMHPSFPSLAHCNSEPIHFDFASPSTSPSESSHSKRSDASPPETPTSNGGSRGPIFEPPARSSGLLTAEDEALLAAMSLVGRSRSRSSPANRRLPRGGSGLPPQHVPPSLLRRAVSIDPRVEARAVEKRSAERIRGSGEATEWEHRAGASDKDEARGREEMAACQTPKGTWAETSERGFEMHSSERERSERGVGSDKRLKRVEGESAGAAAAWRKAQGSGRLDGEFAVGAEKEFSDSLRRPAEAEGTANTLSGSAGLGEGNSQMEPREPAETMAEAASGSGQERVKQANRGLVLQILGFNDEDDLEGFGRFLSPVRTKVSDGGKSRLAKKRSNSFSEFSTIQSPPKMPGHLRGSIEREEWSPSRGRKGFGFAGFRARKQVPMQPAVANLIAETVEDFWSSDLMGAWGMGQSEMETDDVEPASAPGGSVGPLNDASTSDPASESTKRRLEGTETLALHRRVVSDASPSERAVGEPEGDQPRASLGGRSPRLGTTTEGRSEPTSIAADRPGLPGGGAESELGASAGVAAAVRRMEQVALSREDSLELKSSSGGQSAEQSDAPHDVRGTMPSSWATESEGQASIAGGPPATCSGAKGRDSDGQDASEGGLMQEPAECGASSMSSQGARPRVGPPLLDDVFEDGPDVSRLRQEIDRRDEDIRKFRVARGR